MGWLTYRPEEGVGWEDGVMSDAVPDPSAPEPAQPGIGDLTAGALVFGSSAAVLVVEIVALRLLAPYLGLTLETSTTVIGLAGDPTRRTRFCASRRTPVTPACAARSLTLFRSRTRSSRCGPT